MEFELALVMPIYNEEACVINVINSWRSVLSKQEINYVIIALNDGSTDKTKEKLSDFANDSHVVIINKTNSGHGPTILMGYKIAVECANWVFQCDSDDEMKADYFQYIWRERHKYDALFGTRAGRIQNVSRKLISAFSRLTVSIFFGSGISDVNTAYRLIRAPLLKEIVLQIPSDSFAPNVIISGALSKARSRIFEYPVPMEIRKTGTVSIVKWKLWKSALRSFFQTLRCRPVINGSLLLKNHSDGKD